MTRVDDGSDISAGPLTGGAVAAFARATAPWYQQSQQQIDRVGRINVGSTERTTSVAAGSILALFGLKRGGLAGLITAGIGGALIHRGATGHCYLYQALDVDTDADAQHKHGIHIEQAFLINRPAE